MYDLALVSVLSYRDVILDHAWESAMDEEIVILHKNYTWELITLPLGNKLVVLLGVYSKLSQMDRLNN